MLALEYASFGCAVGGFGLLITQNRRAHAQLDRQRRHLELREVWYRDHAAGFIAAARRSPAAVIERLAEASLRLAPAIESVIFAEPQDDALVVSFARGVNAGFVVDMRLDPAGHSALARAIQSGYRITTGAADVQTLVGEGAYAAIPLLSRGRILGAVGFFAACRNDLGDIDELVRFAELTAPAYEIALERRADVAAATLDGLTGLLTPVVFRQRLAEEVLAAKRAHLPYALIFIDTDHFKSCNDRLGHAAGDAVLTAIARLLSDLGGHDAIVGRNGGDEFCIAVPAAKSSALRTAERIRSAIAGHPFAALLGSAPPEPITASIGVAVMPDDAQSARELLEAADAAMYASKRAGRNRVSAV